MHFFPGLMWWYFSWTFALLVPWISPLLSLLYPINRTANWALFVPFAAKITCNGELAFYDQRLDKLVVSRSPANISLWSTIDSGIQVLAVSCHSNKTKPWIIASVSNGMVTDDRWKCFSQEKEGLDNMNWVTSLFDDTHWAQAVANYSNTHSPWGKVPDISNNAFWISTADKDDSKLFCRRRLSEVSLIRKRSNSKIFIISRLNHHHHHHLAVTVCKTGYGYTLIKLDQHVLWSNASMVEPFLFNRVRLSAPRPNNVIISSCPKENQNGHHRQNVLILEKAILIGISGTLLTSTIFITSLGIFQATLDDVDHSLFSHLRSRHKVRDVIDCLKKCRDDLQCLSFNFQYTTVVPSKNSCELNGVTKGQDPKNHVRRPGYTYYENVEWLGERCSLKWNSKVHLFLKIVIYCWPRPDKIRANVKEFWTIYFDIRRRIYVGSHTTDLTVMRWSLEMGGWFIGGNNRYNNNKACENKDKMSYFSAVRWLPSQSTAKMYHFLIPNVH